MKINFTCLFFSFITSLNAQNYSIGEAIALANSMEKIELLSEKGKDLLIESIRKKELVSGRFPDISTGNIKTVDSLKSSVILRPLWCIFIRLQTMQRLLLE